MCSLLSRRTLSYGNWIVREHCAKCAGKFTAAVETRQLRSLRIDILSFRCGNLFLDGERMDFTLSRNMIIQT